MVVVPFHFLTGRVNHSLKCTVQRKEKTDIEDTFHRARVSRLPLGYQGHTDAVSRPSHTWPFKSHYFFGLGKLHSSGNPAHKPPVREVLDEKDDLSSILRAARRWGESKMKSGEGGIALENPRSLLYLTSAS